TRIYRGEKWATLMRKKWRTGEWQITSEADKRYNGSRIESDPRSLPTNLSSIMRRCDVAGRLHRCVLIPNPTRGKNEIRFGSKNKGIGDGCLRFSGLFRGVRGGSR